ncbi:MAG: thiamine-phosphate kinase [Gemmatimonadaceae bacterium]
MTHTPFGPGKEFDSIRTMLDVWGPVAHGIGDDAAILTVPPGQQLIVSTDASVEDVHFRHAWMSPENIGERAATAALSDLAAMGARADSVLVSIIAPASWREYLPTFAAGVKHSVQAAGARIVGGNIALGREVSCTFTVIGYTDTPVKRSGAAAGDLLFVTGTLGGPGTALLALERGQTPPVWALDRFLHPVARLDAGLWLARNSAQAMIDISDGLAADARHLATAGGLVAELWPESVPRFEGVSATDALASGEEYELLVALPEHMAAEVARTFHETFRLPLTQVGILRSSTTPEGDRPNSASRVELPGGHDHFSSR